MIMTTIHITDNTKTKLLRYGNMGETYDDVINRMFDEIEKLKSKV